MIILLGMHHSPVLPTKSPSAGLRTAFSAVGLLAWLAPMLMVLGLLLSSCSSPPKPQIDVLIYVLDACRPDRLGTYGYPLPTSPNIDALASDPDAVVFDQHYVAGTWTKPSVASLFTGRAVHQHGVTEPHRLVEGGRYQTQALAESFPTLAERFQAAGFATLGLVTSDHLSPRYGFARGFDLYLGPEELPVDDGGRNRRFADWIREVHSPYFAYVHQNACHNPYPVDDRDAEFMENHGPTYDEEARRREGIDFTTNALRGPLLQGDISPTREDRRFLSAIYDAKLRRVDRTLVGPLVDELQASGRWDRTLLILTADHGEELLEHGGYGHGLSLWQEVVRVPLIVKFPRGERPPGLGSNSPTLTSNVDLLPFLLDYFGLESPEGLDGRSFLRAATQRISLTENRGDWALIRDGHKVVVTEGKSPQLFDLKADPHEHLDLSGTQVDRLQALLHLGESIGAGLAGEAAPKVQSELSADAVDRLRSLGYLD